MPHQVVQSNTMNMFEIFVRCTALIEEFADAKRRVAPIMANLMFQTLHKTTADWYKQMSLQAGLGLQYTLPYKIMKSFKNSQFFW